MPWRHNGLNKFSFLLFHQLYWSYIQNSFCKSFKITTFYKNSSQFSSSRKTCYREPFLQILMFSYNDALIKKISLYTSHSKFYAVFPPPLSHHFTFPITACLLYAISQIIICCGFSFSVTIDIHSVKSFLASFLTFPNLKVFTYSVYKR